MHDYLFEVYHYCTEQDKLEGRRSPNGFHETMEEAERAIVRLTRYARLRDMPVKYYIQQFDMDNIIEFFREHPV